MTETGILGVRSWRLQKGVSLESIARATKLSVRHLAAIEDGDFSRLPGGIYNTSYIRQYAKAIDFDESDLLAYYCEACYPSSEAAADAAIPASRWSRWLFSSALHRA